MCSASTTGRMCTGRNDVTLPADPIVWPLTFFKDRTTSTLRNGGYQSLSRTNCIRCDNPRLVLYPESPPNRRSRTRIRDGPGSIDGDSFSFHPHFETRVKVLLRTRLFLRTTTWP